MSEILKAGLHRGNSRSLYSYRDRKGLEVDLLIEGAGASWIVEAKSFQTIADDLFRNALTLGAGFEKREGKPALCGSSGGTGRRNGAPGRPPP